MRIKIEKVKEKIDSKRISSTLGHLETFASVVNQALIAITTIYITWYSFHVGFQEYQTTHAWFTTVGYQFFMSEGIIIMNNKNLLNKLIKSRELKVRLHWILQAIGSSFALFGIPWQIYNRQITGRTHFHNTHGITGLTSGILLLLTLISGCSALFSLELKRYIKPLFSKGVHNFLASACYVVGMISVISAYITRSWLKKADPGEVRYIMVWCNIFVIILTMIGPIKTVINQFKHK